MENASAQVMPWLGSVSAVLEAWFPGQQGGAAIANLLFGAVNPSGKLPITFPASVNQLPRPVIPTPPDSTTPFPVNYYEGFNVGYKWYDSQGLTPLFLRFWIVVYHFLVLERGGVDNLVSAQPELPGYFHPDQYGRGGRRGGPGNLSGLPRRDRRTRPNASWHGRRCFSSPARHSR